MSVQNLQLALQLAYEKSLQDQDSLYRLAGQPDDFYAALSEFLKQKTGEAYPIDSLKWFLSHDDKRRKQRIAYKLEYTRRLDDQTDNVYKEIGDFIAKKTKQTLSLNTIKRFFGKIKDGTEISQANLDIIARAVGAPSYVAFCHSFKGEENIQVQHEVRITDPSYEGSHLCFQQINWFDPRYVDTPTVCYRFMWRNEAGAQTYFWQGAFIRSPQELHRLLDLARQEGWWPATEPAN
jgi:hypothetical protein